VTGTEKKGPGADRGCGVGTGEPDLERAPDPDNSKKTPDLQDTIEAAKFARDLARDELRLVLDRIVGLLKKYVVLPDHGAEAIALYIFQTWLLSRCEFAPMLVFTSPEMRSGKTTVLSIVAELVREPESAANASPAALFRLIEATNPTLLLDEVDAFLAQKSESTEAVRGILNAGHRRGRFSCVLRVEAVKDNQFVVSRFSVFGFKVLAGIGQVPPTWRDRSILVPLRRKKPDEKVASFRIHRMQEELDTTRARIGQTAEMVAPFINPAQDPDFPDGLHDRAMDNWELAFQLAQFAGGSWPERAAAAALAFSSTVDDDSQSAGILLLDDLKHFFATTGKTGFFTDDILENLHGLEERPWSAWSRGKPISAAQVARILRNYDIRPGVLSIGGEKKRGYKLENFLDAFARYTSPDLPVTPLPNEDKTLWDNDLAGNGKGNGLHSEPLPEDENGDSDGKGNTSGRNPLPHPLRTKPLQDNELRPEGNGVTPESGEGGSLWI